jgi:putative transposase
LELVVDAEAIRKVHPGCGVEKLYYILMPDFIGRDKFIETMMDVGF